MTERPRTLLEIARAASAPSALQHSALLLIDAQLEYVTGSLPLDGIEQALAESVRLLALARREGTPVFHVVHHGRDGAPAFDPAGVFVAIVPELSPEPGEPVIVKRLPNAFAGTELDAMVRATGRTELIIAGFATHMCVSSTARSAIDLGYRSTIVAAATATRTLPDPLGPGLVPAVQIQQAALAALADRFAIIVADCSALEGAA